MHNANLFNLLASDKRWGELAGAVKAVRGDMKSLAPHPHHKNDNPAAGMGGPAALAVDDRDGALGGLILDALVGGSFGSTMASTLDLPSCISNIDFSHVVDVYDEYRHDRANSEPKGFVIGEGGSMAGGFNTASGARPFLRSAEEAEWDAYFSTLPRRRAMEQTLAGLNHSMRQIEMTYRQQPPKMAFGL